MDASKFRSVRPMVPDVLVLGGGGLVGEAWMSGFLAGAQSAWGVDFREAREFVGTSAGSIVAAHLAKGIEPRVPPGPVRAAPTDATAHDIFNAGGATRLSRVGECGVPDYTTGHHGRRDGGCVGPRRPPCWSASWHAINGGPQRKVRRSIGITLRPAVADCRG